MFLAQKKMSFLMFNVDRICAIGKPNGIYIIHARNDSMNVLFKRKSFQDHPPSLFAIFTSSSNAPDGNDEIFSVVYTIRQFNARIE